MKFDDFSAQDGSENDRKLAQDHSKTIPKTIIFNVELLFQFWTVLGSVLAPSWDPFGLHFPTFLHHIFGDEFCIDFRWISDWIFIDFQWFSIDFLSIFDWSSIDFRLIFDRFSTDFRLKIDRKILNYSDALGRISANKIRKSHIKSFQLHPRRLFSWL